MKKILITLIILSLSCLLISCGEDLHSEQSQVSDSIKIEQNNGPQSGANDVVFSVKDTKGVIHQSSEWIGKKPVVINIWGTWCPPCRAEIPAFVKAYDIYAEKGIEILGIAVKDTPDKVIAFAEQNNMKWQMLMLSTDELIKRFKLQSVPTTIFIDRTGKVMEIINPRTNTMTESFSGAMHYEQFTAHLDSLLTL